MTADTKHGSVTPREAAPPALDVSPEALKAASVAALDKAEAAHRFALATQSYGANLWHLPAGFEGWTVVRLIPRNHPNERMRGLHEKLESDLRQFGWVTAPAGTFHADYMSDGDYKRWLVIPPDGEKRYREMKLAAAQRKRTREQVDPLRAAAESLQGIKGVAVTRFEEAQKEVRVPRR